LRLFLQILCFFGETFFCKIFPEDFTKLLKKIIFLVSGFFLFTNLSLATDSEFCQQFKKLNLQNCATINSSTVFKNLFFPILQSGDFEAGKKYFLANMDQKFQDFLDQFSVISSQDKCRAQKPIREAFSISSFEDFSCARQIEFQQFNCAVFQLLDDNIIWKTQNSNNNFISRNQIFKEQDYIKEEIQEEVELLEISLQIALNDTQEMANYWPLHERLNCLFLSLNREREVLLNFLKIYDDLPGKFKNSASQYAGN